MKSSNLFRVAFTALALAVAACSSTPAKDTDKDKADKDKPLMPANPFKADSARDLANKESKLSADGLYRQARLALDASDFSTAISRYNQIAARFPFTEYATQADLERVYALYRSFQPDDALTAADKFLKEHPRHPAADYVQYIKGLVNTSRDEGLSGALGLDNTKEDVSYLRRAFDDFSLLAQKYPTSLYAGDARQHMIDLRNRIAQHDLHIVHYYVKRGAFIAAAKRSEQILLQYPGAPATLETMEILEKCYRQMGLNEQANEVHKLYVAQMAQPTPQTDYPTPPKKAGLFASIVNMFSSKPKAPAAPAPVPAPAAIAPKASAAPAAIPASAAPAAAVAPAAADQRSWLQRLFTPGSQELEGATVVIPSQSSQPAATTNTDASTKPDAAAKSSATSGADAAKSSEGGLHGNGFSITMEPYVYDDGDSKKPADKPAAPPATAAPAASAPAPAPVAPSAAPATTQDPAEAPTFSNWLRHTFSSDKKPAATVTAAAPSAQPSKAATDANTSAKPADENKAPTLMDLLYQSVTSDKKKTEDSTTTAPADSEPATTP